MAKIMVQYGRPNRSSWAEYVRSSFGRTLVGKVRKTYTGNASLYIVKKDYSHLCLWMTLNLLERNKILIRCGNYSKKKSIGRTNIFLGSCILGLHSTTMWNKQRHCGPITEPCLNREFPRGEQRTCHTLRIFVFLHGLMIWRVMQRNVWSDIVSWRTRRLNNSPKYLLHASMTSTSKKKKQNLLENCQIHALKLFWNAYIWQELDDLIYCGQ